MKSTFLKKHMNSIIHQENTNQNHNEIQVHIHQNDYDKKILKKKSTSVGKDVEKLESSYIAGGKRKWCSLFGKQAVSQKIKYVYHMTQQLHSWYIPKKNEDL